FFADPVAPEAPAGEFLFANAGGRSPAAPAPSPFDLPPASVYPAVSSAPFPSAAPYPSAAPFPSALPPFPGEAPAFGDIAPMDSPRLAGYGSPIPAASLPLRAADAAAPATVWEAPSI